MGGLVYFYRIGSLILATFMAVIVLGLCVSSLNTYHQGVEDGDLNPLSLTYTKIGIVSGAMAILTLPVMLLVDLIKDGRVGVPVMLEVPWLFVITVMFLATGISTKNFVHKINPDGASCDVLDIFGSLAKELVDVCRKWGPIEIVSWITAGIVFLYAVTLTVITVKKGNSGSSMWGTSVKNGDV